MAGADVLGRRADAGDAPAILAVHQASVLTLSRAHDTAAQIEAWVAHNAAGDYVRAMGSGEAVWVAVQGGRVLGFAGRRGDEIRAVYVHPDGAGRGIGRRLLEAAEDSARQDAIMSLHLDASRNAVPAYLAMGFGAGSVRSHRLRDGTVIRQYL